MTMIPNRRMTFNRVEIVLRYPRASDHWGCSYALQVADLDGISVPRVEVHGCIGGLIEPCKGINDAPPMDGMLNVGVHREGWGSADHLNAHEKV